MQSRLFLHAFLFTLALSFCPPLAAQLPAGDRGGDDPVLWEVQPRASLYKYFGKRIVDVNRAQAGELTPPEFGWQGNQLTLIFRLTSKQLDFPEYEFSFKVFHANYDVDEIVQLDIFAGTNINNLKPVEQGIIIRELGTYTLRIPSSYFYLGSQNFISIAGVNVDPTGYGENPPNCRFEYFKLEALASAQAEDREKAGASTLSFTPISKTIPQ